MDFTAKDIITAILGSAGFIGGLFTLVNIILARIDRRKDKANEKAKAHASETAELRRIDLEEEQAEQDGWESLAKERGVEIKDLKAEIKELKDSNTLSRPTVTNIYKGLTHLENRIKALKIAKLPDEVVDILNERRQEALEEIGKLRDLLP